MEPLKDLRYDAQSCVGCKGCSWVDHIYMSGVRFGVKCPSLARYLFDAYAAYGRLKIALALMEGRLDYSPQLLEVIYKCTLCGACDVGCKRNLDLEPLLVLEALRESCVQEGKGPMPEHKRIGENIEQSKNRYGMSGKDRLNWIPQGSPLSKKAEIFYFVGCTTSYTHPEIAHQTLRILDKSGSEFMVMGPQEWCCGYILHATGQIDLFKKMAQHNLMTIKESGADVVLTSCPHCYKTLKVDYPKVMGKSTHDLGFQVLHLTEYVNKLLEEEKLKLTKEWKVKVTYHDPCHLARLSEPWIPWKGRRGKYGILAPPKEFRRGTHGVYKPPRNILKSIPGLELEELIRARENAWCCGAGGGVREAFPDFALWTASERLEEVKISGAEAIVTCCPYCKENLSEAIEKRRERVKVYDLSEVIAEVIS